MKSKCIYSLFVFCLEICSVVPVLTAHSGCLIPLQNASECSAPTCRCAQPLNAPCQPIAYTVSLSTLPRQLLVHDHDYFLSVTATNNAGLPTVRQIQFTVDVSPPRGGYLQDSFAGSQDVNFQSSMLHRYSWSGFVDGDTEIQHYQFYVGSSCLPASNFTHPAQPTVSVLSDRFTILEVREFE